MYKRKQTLESLNTYAKLTSDANKLKDELVNQFEFVLGAAYGALGYDIDHWYVHNALEGEVGDLDNILVASDLDRETIDITNLIISDNRDDGIIDLSEDDGSIIIDDSLYWLSEVILTKWLFMSYDDIVTEVKSGRERFLLSKEKEREAKLASRTKLKESERKLLDRIEAKLSPEEKKFLQRKFK